MTTKKDPLQRQRPTEPESPAQRIKPTLILGSGATMVTLDAGEEYRPALKAVDLCFVFDTTGSMSDKIEGLTTCMVDFVVELSRLSLDWRVTVVPFGDLTVPGDRIVGDLPFTRDRLAAESMLRSMPRNSGGGNEGESALEAVRAALAKPFRSDAVTVLVVLTDEPALTSPQLTPKHIRRELAQAEAVTFVVAPPLDYYKDWAARTGGEWFEISSAVDTESILSLLRGLAQEVASVADQVHSLAGGSVATYLALDRGN